MGTRVHHQSSPVKAMEDRVKYKDRYIDEHSGTLDEQLSFAQAWWRRLRIVELSGLKHQGSTRSYGLI